LKNISERSSRSRCWCSKGIPHRESPARPEGGWDEPVVLEHAFLPRLECSCGFSADPRHGSLRRPQGARS
jgi:hypothetical protein